jgi:hypothetical protein
VEPLNRIDYKLIANFKFKPNVKVKVHRNYQTFRRLFIVTIKSILLLLVIWFVGKALYNSIHQVNWSMLTIKPLPMILGALFLFSSNIFGSWIQRTFYRELDFIISWTQSFALYGTPQLAKYLPGKLWSIIGYTGIAKRFTIPVIISSAAVFILGVWGLMGASLLGVILALLNPSMIGGLAVLNKGVIVAMVILLLIFLHPKFYLRIVNIVLLLFKQPPIPLHFPWRSMMAIVGEGFILNSLYFLGVSLIISSIVELPGSMLPLFVGIFCLANIAGFLALFAPAGIGVREGILLLVLGPLVGAGLASVIAILARLIQTIADIFSTVLGFVTFYFAKKNTITE